MKFYTVDAFASKPFTGNPAAVMPLDEALSDRLMQQIASEINLSETAFLTMIDKEADWKSCTKFKLRWFTPTNEVRLCGHATLASAHVIFSELGNTSKMLEFDTKSGILTAVREGEEIALNLPTFKVKPISSEQNEKFSKLIRAAIKLCSVDTVHIDSNTKKLLIRLDDKVTRDQIESIVPDISTMNTYDGAEFKGIVVTVKARSHGKDGKYDFFSRYFGPWNGIPEDPVTGSAHSILAPFWSDKLNKTEMYCRQCSRRGGDLHLILKSGRLDILGEAVTVTEGNIRMG